IIPPTCKEGAPQFGQGASFIGREALQYTQSIMSPSPLATTDLISNPFERGILWGHPITCPPGRVPRQRAAALCTPADFHHSSAGVDIIHLCGGCGLCRLRRQSPHPPHNSCELPEAVRSQEEHDLKSYRN